MKDTVNYNRAEVMKTGVKNQELHALAIKAAEAKAAEVIADFTAKAIPALVRGEDVTVKAPTITIIKDQSKRYADYLVTLQHIAGELVPGSDEVTFLLKNPDDVNKGVETQITVCPA